jgi:hypothetical protein
MKSSSYFLTDKLACCNSLGQRLDLLYKFTALCARECSHHCIGVWRNEEAQSEQTCRLLLAGTLTCLLSQAPIKCKVPELN